MSGLNWKVLLDGSESHVTCWTCISVWAALNSCSCFCTMKEKKYFRSCFLSKRLTWTAMFSKVGVYILFHMCTRWVSTWKHAVNLFCSCQCVPCDCSIHFSCVLHSSSFCSPVSAKQQRNKCFVFDIVHFSNPLCSRKQNLNHISISQM